MATRKSKEVLVPAKKFSCIVTLKYTWECGSCGSINITQEREPLKVLVCGRCGSKTKVPNGDSR